MDTPRFPLGVHQLLLHLLLGGAVGSPGIFFLDCTLPGGKRRLLHHVFLLLDRRWNQHHLHDQGKQQQCDQIVSEGNAVAEIEDPAHGNLQNVPKLLDIEGFALLGGIPDLGLLFFGKGCRFVAVQFNVLFRQQIVFRLLQRLFSAGAKGEKEDNGAEQRRDSFNFQLDRP